MTTRENCQQGLLDKKTPESIAKKDCQEGLPEGLSERSARKDGQKGSPEKTARKDCQKGQLRRIDRMDVRRGSPKMLGIEAGQKEKPETESIAALNRKSHSGFVDPSSLPPVSIFSSFFFGSGKWGYIFCIVSRYVSDLEL